LVPNLADQAPVTDPVFLERSELAAVKRFTDGARIVQYGHSIAQEVADSLCDWTIQFSELFLGAG
jgi:hypothetical protein